jgi:hypothetical protein
MTIIAIDENSPHLEPVLALARANSSTLGFLPRAAFIESARDRKLLVATDKEGKFLGYLLYGISGRKMLAYIKHLCILPKHRKSKVATFLVQELRAQTSDMFRGIRVRCRRDYEASKVWPSLGFSALEEIPGRGKKETTLTVWWFDYGHPTLFTSVDDLEGSSKVKVSMDANVFFYLNEPTSRQYVECQALLADWLTEGIELCVTNELFNEIDRQSDRKIRVASRSSARKFRVVSGPEDEFQSARVTLRSLFPDQLTTSDKSDIPQIARSVAAGIQFFITLDPRLLEIADEIFEKLGIRVLRPAELIVGQDTLSREADQPVRFAGASMVIERARALEQPL